MSSKSPLSRWILMLLGLCFCLPLTAQILPPDNNGQLNPDDPDYDPELARQRKPQLQRKAERDTFGIFAFKVDNPNVETAFKDSLLDNFQAYDPSRAIDFDYGVNGILGGVAYPLRYRPRERRGLDLGLHQFDLYQLTGHNMDFYRQQKPYTDLKFVQGSEQNDFLLETKFSRNFADGVNFVFDYRRTSQRGRRDQYPNQNLRNTNLATGFWINHGGGKYDAFVSFAANTYEQQQNGGVTQLPERSRNFTTPFSALVYLNDGFLRQSHREWMLTQYLQFGGKTDTLGKTSRAYTLSHQFQLNTVKNRLTVPPNAGDTLFQLRRFPHFNIDSRGQRSLITNRTIENSFRISTFRKGKSDDNASVQKDIIEVGLIHQLHKLRYEPRDSTINNLMLTGRLGFRPGNRLNVIADGRINLADQLGDFQIKAAGELDLQRFGKLELNFLSQLATPTLIQQAYDLTTQSIYRNNFNKTLETRLEGALTFPVVGIRAGLAYNLLTDYIYADTLGYPQQRSGVVNLIQLTAERNFKFGAFNLHNRLLFQTTDADEIRLPSLIGEHSIFYGGKWFKVLNVQLGIDLRYFDSFKPYYYNPVVQQFQLQERQTTDFFLQADAFFSMRVTRFRFFFKFEQLNKLWNDQFLYLLAEQPYPDQASRIGIRWRLVN